MDTSDYILICDVLIMLLVWATHRILNVFTATTTDADGGKHLTSTAESLLREVPFYLYMLFWPLHLLVREFFQ